MIETAPAKLNLALHVRAREPDGYHRLETLFAFCADGDRVEAMSGGGEIAASVPWVSSTLPVPGPNRETAAAGDGGSTPDQARRVGAEARSEDAATRTVPDLGEGALADGPRRPQGGGASSIVSSARGRGESLAAGEGAPAPDRGGGDGMGGGPVTGAGAKASAGDPASSPAVAPDPIRGEASSSTRSAGLTISGPFAEGLSAGPDNLVLRAAAAMAGAFGIAVPPLRLTKILPIAAGVGGGSADAAAAMRLLARMNGIALDDPRLHAIAAGLGADVPACLVSRSVKGEGRGDALTPWRNPFAGLPVLLANPRVACPTGPVFARWDGEDRGPLTDDPAGWRNDLEAPAVALAPAIAGLLAEMRALPGAALVRMSGSGATCFALFDDAALRDAAAVELAAAGHWTLATVIL